MFVVAMLSFADTRARDGDSLPIPIRESAAELAIEWHADYRVEGRRKYVALWR